MRWTIPTLIDTLYRNGLKLDTAGDIVAATYPLTQGADDFVADSWVTDSPTVVGPYALYEHVRGEYPSDAPTHAGADARTIVAAMRGYDGQIADIVDIDVPRDAVVLETVKRTLDYIRQGGAVEPTTMAENPHQELRVQELAEAATVTDMAIDSLRSLPLPTFGA